MADFRWPTPRVPAADFRLPMLPVSVARRPGRSRTRPRWRSLQLMRVPEPAPVAELAVRVVPVAARPAVVPAVRVVPVVAARPVVVPVVRVALVARLPVVLVELVVARPVVVLVAQVPVARLALVVARPAVVLVAARRALVVPAVGPVASTPRSSDR